MSRFHTSRRASSGIRPLVAFLLIASFGILFAGCKGPDDVQQPDYTFTEQDLAQRDQLASASGATQDTGTGAAPYIEPLTDSGNTADTGPVLDLGLAKKYDAIRTGVKQPAGGGNIFRVTNSFVNMRATPDSNGTFVAKINGGELLDVESFPNAGWAKVKVVSTGQEGYVAERYIAKLVADDQVAAEKQAYNGQYFVNYGYVNVRQSPSSSAEKIGQIPGQTIIKPASVENGWAKVTVDGKDGYVSMQYISPFLPNMIVRQETYQLPILAYDLRQQGALQTLTDHLAKLSAAGEKFVSLKDLYNVLVAQEAGNANLPSKSVAILVLGVTAQNEADLSSALLNANAKATLFIETKELGIQGITEKMAATLAADGFDLESAGHTGDDLRGLTNAQLDLELGQSRQLLEQITGGTVFAIAYPLGGTNPRVEDAASKAGYLLGVTDTPGKTFNRENLLSLPSYFVSPTTSADDVLRYIQS